jgi:hypothetical protein
VSFFIAKMPLPLLTGSELMENHSTLHNEERTAINTAESAVTTGSNPGHTHTLDEGATDVTATAEELNYVEGVTSSVQDQLDDKLAIASKATAAEVVARTDDDKYVTSLAVAPYANSSMSRQAIINGNFNVNQRGSTLTPGATTTALLSDHWKIQQGADGGTLPTVVHTIKTFPVGALQGSYNYYEIAPNGAGTSLGNGSYGWLEQRIEHGNRFLCGLNKTVTLSFWASSNIANKKLGIALVQNYGSGGSPTTAEELGGEVISLTSTLTKYTKTFTTNTLTGKTFGTANDDFLRVMFGYQWGSTFNTRFGAGSAETYVGSGNINIAQVQLCAGDVALPFQPKSFEEELRACQRYYEKSYDYAVAPGAASALGSLTHAVSGTAGRMYAQYKVSKRVAPTATETYSPITGSASNVRDTIGAADVSATEANIGESGHQINFTATDTRVYLAHWEASAEL